MPPTSAIKIRRTSVAFALLFLALAIGVAKTKAPWTDEIFYASPALDLLTRGTFGVSVMEPTGCVALPAGTVYTGVNRHIYVPAILHFFLSAIWYKITGFSIITIRLYSLLWGIYFLAACYFVLEKMSKRPLAALAGTICVALNHIFINGAADGRPDIVCAALGIWALAAYLLLREGRMPLAILVSQSLLAAAAVIHPAAFLYLVGVMITTAYHDLRRLRVHYLLIAAIPYVIVFGGWAALMYGDQSTARAQLQIMFSHRVGTRPGLLAALRNEWLNRYWGSYFAPNATGTARLKVLLLLFYPVSLFAGAFVARRHPEYRLLVILALSNCLTLTFLDAYRLHYYLIHTLPWFCMLLGVSLVAFWDRGGTLRRVLVALAAGLFLTMNVAWTAYGIYRDPLHHEFADTARAAREHAGPSDPVTGPLEMGLIFGFYDNFVDDVALGFYTGRKAQVIIVDELGYAQAFNNFRATAPDLSRHISHLFDQDYTLVHLNRLYRVYVRN